MSIISMKQLLEAGVHFGHQTRKWNPKMKKYIFTDRNKVHIINLEDTSKQIDKAYYFVKDAVNAGAKVLFVVTKKQVKDAVMEEATRCGMFYVNSRWLGGTLTNFKTIRSRVERMIKLENMEKSGEFDLLPKKEVVVLKNELAKLQTYLNGIRDMTSLPNLIIMVDPNEEHICVNEARILNIPTVGLVDTNADPDDVTVCIPANDDAIRSVKLILGALADAIIEAKDGVTLHTLEDSEEKMTMDSVVNESATSNEENK